MKENLQILATLGSALAVYVFLRSGAQKEAKEIKNEIKEIKDEIKEIKTELRNIDTLVSRIEDHLVGMHHY